MAAALITRKEARAQGLTRYLTGNACPHGHVAERLVSTCGCVECVRLKANARNLPGGSRQPKGIRAANARARSDARAKGMLRYLSAAPCGRCGQSERRTSTAQCIVCLENWRREWRKRHRADENERERTRRLATPDKVRASYKSWQSTDKGRAVKARLQRERRARLRGAGGKHTAADIDEILAAQNGRCAYCRTDLRSGYEVDHIIPLAKGGTNGRRNIQVLCPTCNRHKRTKDPIQFAQEMGRLI